MANISEHSSGESVGDVRWKRGPCRETLESASQHTVEVDEGSTHVAEGCDPCLTMKSVWSLKEWQYGAVRLPKRPVPSKMNYVGTKEKPYRFQPAWEMELLTKWRRIKAEWETKHGGNSND